jgi:hypothetical protein
VSWQSLAEIGPAVQEELGVQTNGRPNGQTEPFYKISKFTYLDINNDLMGKLQSSPVNRRQNTTYTIVPGGKPTSNYQI